MDTDRETDRHAPTNMLIAILRISLAGKVRVINIEFKPGSYTGSRSLLSNMLVHVDTRH